MRFEVRSGGSELDLVDAVAKIESLTVLRWRPEQSLETAPEIGGLADVRLAFTSKQENRRNCRQFLKEALVLIRRECEGAREHRDIVVPLPAEASACIRARLSTAEKDLGRTEAASAAASEPKGEAPS